MTEKLSIKEYRAQNLPGISAANHSNRGKGFEKSLEAVNDWYLQAGRAHIVKNPNEWIFIGYSEYLRMKAFDAHTVAATPENRYLKMTASNVDFTGGGEDFSVAFDAKQTNKKNFPLSIIKLHQIARLRQSARCGCVAGVVILFEQADRVFFAPVHFLDEKITAWRKQPGRAKSGTASISISELEAVGAEVFKHKTNSLWDYLPILLRKKI